MASKKIVTTKVTKPITQEKRLKVNQAWANLFSTNEKASKGERKTDEQLVKEMQKLFPDKKDKSTITRPNMIRSIYNKGTNMFKKFGPAKAKSRRFDAAGEVIEGRVMSERPAKAKVAAEPAAKKKVILKKKTAATA